MSNKFQYMLAQRVSELQLCDHIDHDRRVLNPDADNWQFPTMYHSISGTWATEPLAHRPPSYCILLSGSYARYGEEIELELDLVNFRLFCHRHINWNQIAVRALILICVERNELPAILCWNAALSRRSSVQSFSSILTVYNCPASNIWHVAAPAQNHNLEPPSNALGG